MDVELQRFGSTFSYRDGDYVFLGYEPERNRIFAAKILDRNLTIRYQSMVTKYVSRPHHPMSETLALCFCILSTEGYKNRVAAFQGTGDNVDSDGEFQPLNIELNGEDIKKLKDTILSDKAIMPPKLVEIVEALG